MSVFFFFKQKTAYEMRISDWSSDVCSSDLLIRQHPHRQCVKIGTIIVQYRTIVTGEQISGLSGAVGFEQGRLDFAVGPAPVQRLNPRSAPLGHRAPAAVTFEHAGAARRDEPIGQPAAVEPGRSAGHTSELQ